MFFHCMQLVQKYGSLSSSSGVLNDTTRANPAGIGTGLVRRSCINSDMMRLLKTPPLRQEASPLRLSPNFPGTSGWMHACYQATKGRPIVLLVLSLISGAAPVGRGLLGAARYLSPASARPGDCLYFEKAPGTRPG